MPLMFKADIQLTRKEKEFMNYRFMKNGMVKRSLVAVAKIMGTTRQRSYSLQKSCFKKLHMRLVSKLHE